MENGNGVRNGKDKAIEITNVDKHKLEDEDKKDKKSKKEDKPEESVSYYKLFRYANAADYFFMVVGTIGSVAHGVSLPAMFIIFGDITDPFVNYGRAFNLGNFSTDTCLPTTNATSSLGDVDVNYFVMWFAIIAVISWVSGAFQMHFWMLVATRQGHRIKKSFFRSILRQDMTYFDLHSTGELNSRLADDVQKIQNGIGDKLSVFLSMTSRCIAGLIIGFIYSWRLTLVIVAVTPLMAISGGIMMKVSTVLTAKELTAYAKAGAIAEEVLSSMRTVYAFGGEEKEIKRYVAGLKDATKFGIRKGLATGAAMGFTVCILFCVYGLAFWYGSTLIIDYTPPKITVGALLTCFFAVFIAEFSLGQAGPQVESFSIAKGAGYTVFQLIDREPPIDSFSTDGHKPDRCSGRLQFKDIEFSYPSRKDVQILNKVSFVVETGKTVALCGQSGCGKSTCIQLIQRFYDPQAGEIFLDDNDIRTLNVRWLRQNIGIVSQEPVLFDTTIMENIRYGHDGVSDDEIYEAAKQANAYDFIMKLPQKFETMVGEGGTQMSGGQKQRIAIARAIVKNPKIMLLDEATSALDTESEGIVQSALEKASEGRTTIVIAHRLSTIRNADVIIGFSEGEAVERGSHNDLIKLENGVYKNLVDLQHVTHDADEDEIVEPNDENKFTSTRRHVITSTSDKHGLALKEESEPDEEDEKDIPQNVPWSRIMKLNKPELHWVILGSLAALVTGGIQSTYAIMFANFLGAFALIDPDEQRSEVRLYCLLFFGVGLVTLVSTTIQSGSFAKSGEELTVRLREMTFRQFLRQEIGFFDDHKNRTGALTTRLAVDASRVQGVAGIRLGQVCASLGALGVGLGIAFAYSWKMTLLTIAFLPFMMLGALMQWQMMMGQSAKDSKSFEQAGSIATEATMNIRTVASLSKENKFLDRYDEALELPYSKMQRKAFVFGLSYGFSEAVILFMFAAVFRFGAFLVSEDCLPFDDMFRVIMAVMMGSMFAAQSASMVPDYAEAKASCARIFHLLDRKTEIDSFSTEGDKPKEYGGRAGVTDCHFCYPSRPDTKVLNGLKVGVETGNTLALVGQSGCGKSTIIQLLLRYYDPSDGSVMMDNSETKALNIRWVRQHIGIVSQEPVLFDRSISENIKYGDNSREVSDEEVIVAAKSANIHDFIDSLPEKYETNVGGKGTQLSGGQKQRVAIARALIKNPKLLLLDEATSALDTESEKIVQEALDTASKGRTCIVIAHRLSTIKNADVIAVVQNGAVVEQGTHSELLALKGSYYGLVNAQLNGASEI